VKVVPQEKSESNNEDGWDSARQRNGQGRRHCYRAITSEVLLPDRSKGVLNEAGTVNKEREITGSEIADCRRMIMKRLALSQDQKMMGNMATNTISRAKDRWFEEQRGRNVSSQ
jgi:hypothetical protein